MYARLCVARDKDGTFGSCLVASRTFWIAAIRCSNTAVWVSHDLTVYVPAQSGGEAEAGSGCARHLKNGQPSESPVDLPC